MNTLDILDEQDKQLINRIQSDFPICPRPFERIAEELDMEEADVRRRLIRLKEAGVIRRVGGNFAPVSLGFVSTLCAASVPPEKIDEFAETVNTYPGVTHNYTRDNHFNVWFTFIAPSMEEIKGNLEDIRQKTGVQEILNLPATDTFKIRAQFSV